MSAAGERIAAAGAVGEVGGVRGTKRALDTDAAQAAASIPKKVARREVQDAEDAEPWSKLKNVVFWVKTHLHCCPPTASRVARQLPYFHSCPHPHPRRTSKKACFALHLHRPPLCGRVALHNGSYQTVLQPSSQEGILCTKCWSIKNVVEIFY